MSTTRWRSAGALVVLAAALAGCARDDGPTRTDSRPIGAFHAIQLNGSAKMQVEVGKGPALSITAGGDLLQDTRTEVRDGVLVVETHERSHWFNRGRVASLAIQAPSLDSVEVNGAGDFTLQDVSGDRLSITVNGAANLKANGSVGSLFARIEGAGRADLSRLQAVDADVAVNGAGKLDVQASGTLTAEVNGVGSIRYSGNPQKVIPAVHGVGSISPVAGK